MNQQENAQVSVGLQVIECASSRVFLIDSCFGRLLCFGAAGVYALLVCMPEMCGNTLLYHNLLLQCVATMFNCCGCIYRGCNSDTTS
jgi:hypothetical protein